MSSQIDLPAAAGPAAEADTEAAHAHPNQFALLGQRRFAPFFWTVFTVALTDNLFKFAVTVLLTYQLSVSWLDPKTAGLVIGVAFILPFLLFSATAGQVTDKLDKRVMVRFVKNLEIAVMLLGAFAFFTDNLDVKVPILLFGVFLMGLHSTIFGPTKYAYLPQALHESELTGGNGMIEMGTFLAILIGNIVGGLLVSMPSVGQQGVAIVCLALALVGRVIAQWVPSAPATDPNLKINWNPFTETWRNLMIARENLTVYRSLLGISWMWFFGAVIISLFPSFAKDVLHGNEQVASLLMVVLSIGIALGSLLCETLSRRHVEIGLVPLGAIGMSVFVIDLGLSATSVGAMLAPAVPWSVGAFLMDSAHWRLMFDLFMLSLFVGLFSVPMYALIQLRSQPTHRARIIAANNILNAIFMITSAVVVGVLLKLAFTIPQVFLLLGLANAIVALYIFSVVPEYLLRFVSWVVSHLIYRFKVEGDQHIPLEGPVILACNHVAYVDAVLLMAASPRPVVFLMDYRIFRHPLLGPLFRLAKAIPIADRKDDPLAYEKAFAAADKVLAAGDVLAIFPEGRLTRDGALGEFKGGIMKIVERNARLNVPVIPMGLSNLWGSFFSHAEAGQAMVAPFRRGVLSRVDLRVGKPIAGNQLELASLKSQVAALLKG